MDGIKVVNKVDIQVSGTEGVVLILGLEIQGNHFEPYFGGASFNF